MRRTTYWATWTSIFLSLIVPSSAKAAAIGNGPLSLAWAVPFVLLLAAIAVGPMVSVAWWHRNDGRVALAAAAAFLIPWGLVYGGSAAITIAIHALVEEYIPFLAVLVALYTITGGMKVEGIGTASPGRNAGLLATGAMLSSIVGTTGAAMLLIRPLIRANEGRPRQAHVYVFFIFLVANAGGALSPLGDPPLFLGFLQGVDFFWPTRALLWPTIALWLSLLAVFFLLDRRVGGFMATPNAPRLRIEGQVNLGLLGIAVVTVLLSGLVKTQVVVDLHGTNVTLESVLRDVGLVALAGLSVAMTPKGLRASNGFSWAPIAEVARVFIGIFVTIAPVIAILKAGDEGALGVVVRSVRHPSGEPHDLAFFWVTGLLSGFLDNAPTYLVFFNVAGIEAKALPAQSSTLAAISAGAVYMGGLSYIGNAPNFMVKSIVESEGVRMPSFFGYLAWSFCVLVPLLAVIGWIFLNVAK